MSNNKIKREYGVFFTEEWLSRELVTRLESDAVRYFADFGSGHGSLVTALLDRWDHLDGSTVEIDAANISLLKSKFPKFHHINLDVTDPGFPDKFWRSCSSYTPDVIVSNPPYIPIPLSKEIRDISMDSGLTKSFGAKSEIPAEILFMLQAIRTMPEYSEMAFIIPDFILTASKNRYIREFMVDKMGLYKVIEVGNKAFRATDVKTHMAFFNKKFEAGLISLSNITSNEAIKVTPDQFIDRGDYTSYRLEVDFRNVIQLGEIAKISRGNLLMYRAKEKAIKPFHTTEFVKFTNDKIDVTAYSLDESFREIAAGDIIIGRVGRNILDHIKIVSSGRATHSDCIIRISLEGNSSFDPDMIVSQMRSPLGRAWLYSKIKGSGAKSLNLKDLSTFPLKLENS